MSMNIITSQKKVFGVPLNHIVVNRRDNSIPQTILRLGQGRREKLNGVKFLRPLSLCRFPGGLCSGLLSHVHFAWSLLLSATNSVDWYRMTDCVMFAQVLSC